MAVVGIADGHAKPPLLAIGEAKWNDTMGVAHIERLMHIRELIAQGGRYDTTGTRLLCFSGAGFNDKAHAAAESSPSIQLVDLAGLYAQA
ncbi:hypothetical protein [Streptomyces bluensis]|uniref:Restriction endonuclease type IV Mrr domain-containing protein n=1 Tax=Streptomyces bluensis TaxID=33897 RepID=A0ABW6UHF9_9ACTN